MCKDNYAIGHGEHERSHSLFLAECGYLRQGSASRDVGDDAQGVPEEDQEHGGIH